MPVSPVTMQNMAHECLSTYVYVWACTCKDICEYLHNYAFVHVPTICRSHTQYVHARTRTATHKVERRSGENLDRMLKGHPGGIWRAHIWAHAGCMTQGALMVTRTGQCGSFCQSASQVLLATGCAVTILEPSMRPEGSKVHRHLTMTAQPEGVTCTTSPGLPRPALTLPDQPRSTRPCLDLPRLCLDCLQSPAKV